MKNVKIYSKQGCGACDSAKAFMDSNKIKYESISLDEDKEAMTNLIEAGVMSLPFIVIGDKELTGFNPSDILKAVK